MDDHFDLLVDAPREEAPGVRVPAPVVVSVIVHALLVLGLVRAYHPIRSDDKPLPIAHYVELIKQIPKDFVEAPGRKVDQAPLNAPWSDANRRASMPKPTGDQPTIRPGDGHRIYTPPIGNAQAQQPKTVQQPTPAQQQSQQQAAAQPSLPADIANTSSRIPPLHQASASGADVNWHSVIKEVSKVATLGGGQNLDLGKLSGSEGGDKGFAAQGPLSFETQWYDWGEYAQSMVGKIRINWYENMPPLIRTGMKGVVTIRFTIQRDGQITNLEMLSSSTVPPYDFAAKKAIELSSKLNPLPKDFPNASERVTCMFFYNSEPK
ncbi:MAG TPA: TonB family protein [Thermoanaerobaculia bacterium]